MLFRLTKLNTENIMCTMTSPTDTDKIIYWAVIRNQTNRHGYLELAHQSGARWLAVMDDFEYKFKTESTEFLHVLKAALDQMPSPEQSPS